MPRADLRPRSRSPRAPGRCCRRTERNACEDIATAFRLLPRPLRRMVHRLTSRPEAVADVSLYRYALPLRTRISAAEKRTGVLMRLVGKDDFVGWGEAAPLPGFSGETVDDVLDQAQEWGRGSRSEEHTSELQSRGHLVCRLLLEKKKKKQ